MIKPTTSATMVVWINRGLEFLWLLTVFLVPLAFLGRDQVLSEAVIAYVEVPKIALLRTLAALMGILWLIEWSIRGGPHSVSQLIDNHSSFQPKAWLIQLVGWVRFRPVRGLFLAVGFYLGTTLISTVLSGSFKVSVWGEIPGQDGYAAYTVVTYVLLFSVVATHLKTRDQLWRLALAVIGMGVLVSGYAVMQHYGHDFLDLTETTGGGQARVTSFMGNAIFSAAVMLMTIPVTLGSAVISIPASEDPGGTVRNRVARLAWGTAILGIWGSVLAIQVLGITFTFSRGPWMGTLLAMVMLLGLMAIFVGWRAIHRAVPLLGLTASLAVAVLQFQGSVSLLGFGPWFGGLIGAMGLAGAGAALLNPRILGRLALVSGLATVLIASILFGPSLIKDSALGGVSDPPTVRADHTGVQVAERFSSIQGEILGGALGGRLTHWRVSWQLIRDHPWFDFDTLKLRWLRPVVGYGPDMFRYTYLLESPPEGRDLYPLEPDHAHNYFIHQTVEQGFLGLFSSLGIFAAIFLIGGSQLIRGREALSDLHKLVIISLLAVVAGRFLEFMVGVPRISDLTVLWVCLGAFAAVPLVMMRDTVVPEAAVTRRGSDRRNRPRTSSSPGMPLVSWQLFCRLGIVAWLIGGIGVLTWFKGINYVLAAEVAQDGVEQFRRRDFQSTLLSFDRAIQLAPDVPSYYNHQAQIYSLYQESKEVPREQECSLQQEIPYTGCLAIEAFRTNLDGVNQRPFYYRSRLASARSAFNLNLNDQAVGFYQDGVALHPQSWLIRNQLAEAYIGAGQPNAALANLEESLAITSGTARVDWASASTLRIQGIAYQDLGELEKAALSFEKSLELSSKGTSPRAVRQSLANVYNALNKPSQAAEQLLVLSQDYLAVDDKQGAKQALLLSTKILDESSRPEWAPDHFFSLGEAYRQLGESKESAQAYDRSARLYDALGPNGLAAKSYFESGSDYRRIGDLEAAVESYGRSGKIYEQLNQLQAAANSFFHQGQTHEKNGDFINAGQAYQLSLALEGPGNQSQMYARTMEQMLERLEQPEIKVNHYIWQAEFYRNRGELGKAIAALEESLILDSSESLSRLVNHKLAETYLQMDRPELAVKPFLLKGQEWWKKADLDELAESLDSKAALLITGDNFLLNNESTADSYYIIGAIYGHLRQYAKAARFLQRSIELDESHPSAKETILILPDLYKNAGDVQSEAQSMFLMAVDFRNQNKLHEAIPLLERSLELDDSSVSFQRGHNLMAEIYAKIGKPDLAAQSYLLEGKAHRDLGDLESAVRSIESSLALDASSSFARTAHGIMGTIYADMERPEKYAQSLSLEGLLYRSEGNLEQAVRLLQRSADIYSEQGLFQMAAEPLYHLGVTYRDNGDYEDAAQALERSVELNLTGQPAQEVQGILANLYGRMHQIQKQAKSLYEQGLAYRDIGNLERAAAAIERSLAVGGQSFETDQAYQTLVDVYIELDNLELAAHYSFLVKPNNRNSYRLITLARLLKSGAKANLDNHRSDLAVRYYYLAGVAYLELGELEESVVSLHQSLEVEYWTGVAPHAHHALADAYERMSLPEMVAKSHYHRGIGYRVQEEWNKAVQFLGSSGQMYIDLELPNLAAQSFFFLAAAYDEMGLLEESAEVLERGLKLEGYNSERTQFLSHLGNVYKRLGELDLSGEYYFQYAVAHHESGHPENSSWSARYSGENFEMVGDVERAAESYFLAGVSYHDLGQNEMAIQFLELSLALDEGNLRSERAHRILSEIY